MAVESNSLILAKVVMHETLTLNGEIKPIIIDSVDGAKVDEIFYPNQEGDLNTLVGGSYEKFLEDNKKDIWDVANTREDCAPLFCEP